jgi:hypothetical protein
VSFTKNEDEIGALWVKSGRNGDYMTGIINGERVVCFVANKSSEKAPDWRVMKSLTREEREAKAMVQAPPVEAPAADDIPF